MHVLAHNIRSMHNVGSLFRTCDGVGADKLYLTGYTACPPRKEISKTALGADEWVAWEHHKDPIELVKQLKNEGFQIIALERNESSVNLKNLTPKTPFCLIVGNEVEGVEEDLLKLADAVAEIPMQGKKDSLNVSVAFGIAAYLLS